MAAVSIHCMKKMSEAFLSNYSKFTEIHLKFTPKPLHKFEFHRAEFRQTLSTAPKFNNDCTKFHQNLFDPECSQQTVRRMHD
jgi:hypothetical protein